jgi:hypothetical protein
MRQSRSSLWCCHEEYNVPCEEGCHMKRALASIAITCLCTIPVVSHGQSFSNPFDSGTHTQEQCGQAHFGKGHSQVCHDLIAQYNIVKRNGNAKETCVRAGVVKEFFLSVQDEQNYKVWQQVEQDECEKARLESRNK